MSKEQSYYDGQFAKIMTQENKSTGDEPFYTEFDPWGISEIAATNPARARYLRLASERLERVRSQAEGKRPREKRTHEIGWKFFIETPQGNVALWNYPGEEGFYLGFPKKAIKELREKHTSLFLDIVDKLARESGQPYDPPHKQRNQELHAKHTLSSMSDQELLATLETFGLEMQLPHIIVPDELIMDTLGVTKAKPVASANGNRLWGKFYGPEEESGGRVWIDSTGFYHHAIGFLDITNPDEPTSVAFGQSASNGIFTVDVPDPQYPEGPTIKPEVIQGYGKKFIRLASEIASLMGGPKSVTIDYGDVVLVPEDLEREGYSDIKGGDRKVITAQKGDSTVLLKSGNVLLPWSTVLRTPTGKISSPDTLANLISEDLLYF